MMKGIALLRRFSTVNKNQMKQFDQMSEWWHPSGPMSVLYLYNYHRVMFLKQYLIKQKQVDCFQPLKDMKILDVGCGAGFLSKSLARLGAEVIGLDPNETSFKQAMEHRKIQQEQFPSLQYINCSLQEYLSKQSGAQFDLVASMDVIEHVDNPKSFVQSLSKAAKNGGLVMLSTIAQNPMSWMTHIVFAEYITNIVPKGTHSYQKFINPNKLQEILLAESIQVTARRHFNVNWRGEFQQSEKGDNYVVIGRKSQTKVITDANK